jgi:ATP-binding cassette subfamily B multidrug efflux pump
MSAQHDRVTGPQGVRVDLRLVARLWPYMAERRLTLLAALGLYITNAACVVLPPFVLQRMLDGAIPSGNRSQLRLLAAAYLGALVLEYVSGFLSEYVVSMLGQRAMSALRRDLFAHVQRLPIAYFEQTPVGRLLTRLTSDVEALAELFATGAITMISDALSVIAVTAMMLVLSPKLTLAAMAIVPILLGLAQLFQRYARRAFQEIRRQIARINAFMAEHLSAMPLVQAFGQQRRTQREFWQLNEAYRDANRQAILADASLYAIVEGIGTMAIAASIAYGAVDLARGAITSGVLVAFIQYIRRFFVPIRDLSTKYTVLQSAFAAAERVFSLLDTKVTLQEAEDALPVHRLERAITLENVCFSFEGPPPPPPGAPAQPEREAGAATSLVPSGAEPGAGAGVEPERWTLQDINLTIRRGERVALVGATGSGKTTLLKLMGRFYDVQRGRVAIDGVDVRALRVAELRTLFAVVLQDAHLFHGTILSNLMLADRIERAAVERALDIVQARPLLARLPQGLDTEVKDLGANFSAGERQVLALARAIALDPQVLLMDEATSNVDSRTEAQMQQAMDVLLEGRTAVIVAHRLSTIEKVDRIVVLERGRIIQEGSHSALMAEDGLYRTLVMQHHRQAG